MRNLYIAGALIVSIYCGIFLTILFYSGGNNLPYTRSCVDGIFYLKGRGYSSTFTLQVDEKGMPVTCDELH